MLSLITLRKKTYKVEAMAAKKSSGKETQWLAAVLNSLAGDGLSPPCEGIHHFEMLIGYYFDDDSGSEFGSECTEAVTSIVCQPNSMTSLHVRDKLTKHRSSGDQVDLLLKSNLS